MPQACARPQVLRLGQGGGEDVDPGMAAGEAVPLVQLQRGARRAVGHDRPPRLDAREAGAQDRRRPRGALGPGVQPPDLRLGGTPEDRADGVGHDEGRVRADPGRDRRGRRLGHEPAEGLEGRLDAHAAPTARTAASARAVSTTAS